MYLVWLVCPADVSLLGWTYQGSKICCLGDRQPLHLERQVKFWQCPFLLSYFPLLWVKVVLLQVGQHPEFVVAGGNVCSECLGLTPADNPVTFTWEDPTSLFPSSSHPFIAEHGVTQPGTPTPLISQGHLSWLCPLSGSPGTTQVAVWKAGKSLALCNPFSTIKTTF